MTSLMSNLAGLVFLAAFVPYMRSIIHGKTKPKRVSWFIWMLTDWITLGMLWLAGAVNGLVVGAVIGATGVFILSLKHGKKGSGFVEPLVLVLGLASIAIWLILDDPVLGLIASVTAIGIATIPTIRSAWDCPEDEDRFAWLIFFIACIFALFGIPSWELRHWLTPVVFFFNEGVMVYILWFSYKARRIRLQ